MKFPQTKKILIYKKDYEDMIKFSRKCFPFEACGLIAKENQGKNRITLSFYFVPNQSKAIGRFFISNGEIKKAKSFYSNFNYKSEICGVFHSHPFGELKPSKQDCISAAKTKLMLWGIYSVRLNKFCLFAMEENQNAIEVIVI